MIETFAALLLAGAQTGPGEGRVRHLHIPCWTGERTWTAEGEPPSAMTVFDTEGEEPPRLIRHDHDMIFNGSEPVQSYNFITYNFDNGDDPFVARAYLDDIDTVSIMFRNAPGPRTIAEARPRIGAGALCYLQKRYRTINVLVESGYERLRAAE